MPATVRTPRPPVIVIVPPVSDTLALPLVTTLKLPLTRAPAALALSVTAALPTPVLTDTEPVVSRVVAPRVIESSPTPALILVLRRRLTVSPATVTVRLSAPALMLVAPPTIRLVLTRLSTSAPAPAEKFRAPPMLTELPRLPIVTRLPPDPA